MFYEPFSCGCAQKYMKIFRIGFLNSFVFFPFYFCCQVLRVTPYRLNVSYMCVCLRGELLPICMLSACLPWARLAVPRADLMWRCSAFPLHLCKPRTSFVIRPGCSLSHLSCLPGHSAEGCLKVPLFLTCCLITWLRKASSTLSAAVWLVFKRSHFITAWSDSSPEP